MMRWVRYALVLLIATRVAAVEILEADPVLSGRLVGPKGVDAVFGEDKWSEDFRLNDYLVGSIFDDVTAESSVLFAFRISESFYSELKTQGKIQFTFTVPSLHEGDPNKVLPVEVWLLERNAVSARAAAQSRPVKLIGTIASEKLQDGQLHKFALDDLGDLQVGDLIWIGLNGRNPLDGAKHNFIVGGDLISLPGSIPPMLILSDEQIFKNPVMGIVPLELLHRRLDAPKRPEINRTAPYNVGNWVNPFIAHRQINQLGEIHQVLRRELDKLPVAQRWFLGQSLGFHSSVKPLNESWALRLPVDGVATAICLIPACNAEGDRVLSFAFPKRFQIIAHRPEGAESLIVADWTSQDYTQKDNTPVVFSFPWQRYSSIELIVDKAEETEGGHFFALEELFLYRPENEEQFPTVVEIDDADSLMAEPTWSPVYLTDGLSSLGPTVMRKVAGNTENTVLFPAGVSESPEIIFTLPKKQLIWSIDLYPLCDPNYPTLPKAPLPGRVMIDFANDSTFDVVVKSIDASQDQRLDPGGENPVKFRFEPVEASNVRLRFEKLPVTNGVATLDLAEVRMNDGHSMAKAQVTLRGFPGSVDPRSFCDNLANGYQLGDPLPWIIRLIRREVMNAELAEVEAGMEYLQAAWQRTFRLLLIMSGVGIIALFTVILIWQSRKSVAENMRVRRRIQQDLHDEIGSNLGTVSLITSHLLRADLSPQLIVELSDVHRSAREATSSLREVIWMTDKSILTLDKAFIYMRMRAEQMVHDSNLVIDAPKFVPSRPISSVFKRNLFLLFTEAIHNCQKHAAASKVEVTLGFSDSAITVRVSDNGRGFDQLAVREGIGMKSMRDRAAQLAGRIEITSIPNVGTTVALTAKIVPAK